MTRRLLAACLILAGCGDAADLEPEVVGYDQLYAQIFATTCTGAVCHSGAGAGGLSFDDADLSFAALVGTSPDNDAAAADGLLRVAPGEPERSFLLTKLTPGADLQALGYGAPMPRAGVSRPGTHARQAIRDWIDAGAPRRGGATWTNDREPLDDYVRCDAADEAGLQACFAPPPPGYLRRYSPILEIPPASEIILCTPIGAPLESRLRMRRFATQQMPGGHHVSLFASDEPAADPSPRECDLDDMLNLRIVGIGIDPFPEGLALEVEAGQQLVLQSHYINATLEPLRVMDAVDLEVVDDGYAITDTFAISDVAFQIPANATVERKAVCTIDETMQIHLLMGHAHELLTHFTVTHVPLAGSPRLLYEEDDGATLRNNAEVALYDPPLVLSPGDRVEVTCAWTNPTDHLVEFPEEMCAAVSYYTPARGFLGCVGENGVPLEVGGSGIGGAGCRLPDAPGNALGVGETCARASDCEDNGEATFCLATFVPEANFCSIILCHDDAECGPGAVCLAAGPGSACVPEGACVDALSGFSP